MFADLALMACLVVLSQAPPSGDWSARALQLSGESDRVRSEALEALRTEPCLRQRLASVLDSSDDDPTTDSRVFLALDVAAALRWAALLPNLVRFSARDETGYSYHAINALMTDSNRVALERLYVGRLTSARKQPKPAAKMAILDSLGRLHVLIPSEDVDRLLFHDPETRVRSAALSYLRALLLFCDSRPCLRDHPRLGAKYTHWVRAAARSGSTAALRSQARWLLAELAR